MDQSNCWMVAREELRRIISTTVYAETRLVVILTFNKQLVSKAQIGRCDLETTQVNLPGKARQASSVPSTSRL